MILQSKYNVLICSVCFVYNTRCERNFRLWKFSFLEFRLIGEYNITVTHMERAEVEALEWSMLKKRETGDFA